MLLPIRPDVLHRVEFRRIGRQVLRHDVPLGEFDELPHQAAAVGRQSIPDNQQRLVDVTHERFEKVDHLDLADRARIEPEVEVAQRQPGRHRELLPVEVELKDGRFPARRPTAATMRLLTSAFVDEDQRAAFVVGFFLMPGQVLRCQLHRRFVALARSADRVAGSKPPQNRRLRGSSPMSDPRASPQRRREAVASGPSSNSAVASRCAASTAACVRLARLDAARPHPAGGIAAATH